MRTGRNRRFLAAFALVALGATAGADGRGIETRAFGEVDGEPVRLFVLTNASGAEVRIIEYGGIVSRIRVPDREGRLGDVALGFDVLADYVAGNPFFGTITGRVVNRIGGGRFELDGTVYELTRNAGSDTVHGGARGFDKVVWKGEPTPAGDGVVLRYVSPDGEEGFPGALETTVTYTWSDDNELGIEYHARTDRPTVVNLTNHSYFHLGDGGAGTVLDHRLTVHADAYTPTQGGLPTGAIVPVEGTPYDFREPRTLGERIGEDEAQLRASGGYNVNYVLRGDASAPALAATVYEPASGRAMDVLTDQPGLQLYTGNFLDGSIEGIGGVAYQRYSGFCLETQHFPDSPNRPEFPSTVLRPSQTYRTTTVYRFYVRGSPD